MKLLAALLFALALVACTEPTPEGPAENAARPCDFPTAEEYCPDCIITTAVDASGSPVEVLARSESLAETYEWVYGEGGELLYVRQSAGLTFGCAGGVIVYARNPVAGRFWCWNEDGEAYHCSGEPPSWARTVDEARDRAIR
jgi:hypothetical protein